MIRARRAPQRSIVCLVSLCALAAGCRRGPPPAPPPKPPVASAQQAGERLRREIPPASVSWDPRTGYAREATSLMGPAAADAANPEASARAFLGAYADLFGIADQQRTLRAAAVSVTRASGERGGITSRIVRFAQVLADLPVHEGEVVVHLTPSSRVLTVFNRYQPGLVPAGAFKLSRDEAIAKARERWKPRKEVSATVASQVIFPVGSEGRRAWRVALDGAVTIVDANTGEILLARDESRRNNTASVFKENNLVDSNTPTTLPIANLDGSGMLTGTRFQITNAAAAAQETSSTSDFLLGPGDPHFDDQMLYFHLETMADFFGGLGAPKPAGQTTVRSNVDSEILGQCNAASSPTRIASSSRPRRRRAARRDAGRRPSTRMPSATSTRTWSWRTRSASPARATRPGRCTRAPPTTSPPRTWGTAAWERASPARRASAILPSSSGIPTTWTRAATSRTAAAASGARPCGRCARRSVRAPRIGC